MPLPMIARVETTTTIHEEFLSGIMCAPVDRWTTTAMMMAT